MAITDGFVTALERNWDMVDRALAGMDAETMARCPNDHCNSVAWILWHMNRVWDGLLHDWLVVSPQIWIQQGWYQKFGMSDDPTNRGTGWTIAQVKSWQPPAREVQLGYYEAMKADIRKYFASVTLDDLERQRAIPADAEVRSVGASVGQRIWDNIAHGGQIAYLRGYYQGMGWFPR
jgi:hypothetical protein